MYAIGWIDPVSGDRVRCDAQDTSCDRAEGKAARSFIKDGLGIRSLDHLCAGQRLEETKWPTSTGIMLRQGSSSMGRSWCGTRFSINPRANHASFMNAGVRQD